MLSVYVHIQSEPLRVGEGRAGGIVGDAALAKDSAVGKAMFALFLLVFAALAAQVFVEQDKLLASRPFDSEDDDL
jgi:hypothetical protein